MLQPWHELEVGHEMELDHEPELGHELEFDYELEVRHKLEVRDKLEVGHDGLGDNAENGVGISEEQMVVDSIDETTGFHDLSAKLSDLNCQGKLKEPLVGDLQGTVKIYKASQDSKATILRNSLKPLCYQGLQARKMDLKNLG
ncbi:hypothetical protein HOY82DRAFT_597941 [Tuber indicum]|nr:hypothetical protein HOY82DRAFT_597941 [Tuber indicum]